MNEVYRDKGCPHTPLPHGVCPHLHTAWVDRLDIDEYYYFFTGAGRQWVLLCPDCRRKPDDILLLCKACTDNCLDHAGWFESGSSGQPEIVRRDVGLDLTRRTRHDWSRGRFIVDVQAFEGGWMALCQDGAVVTISPHDEMVEVGRISLRARSSPGLAERPLHPTRKKAATVGEAQLHTSWDGRFIGVSPPYGDEAFVWDLRTKSDPLRFSRTTCFNNAIFPLAFFESRRGTRVVAPTDWNRLDVFDPVSGACLTQRKPGKEHGEPHALDYFHGGLLVSPQATRIADNGWSWHPLGEVVTWNLSAWIDTNPYESEGGDSRRTLCTRAYYWDGPLCWLSEDVLAVWGFGGDDDAIIPAVRIFNCETGDEGEWFPGPDGHLAFNRYLYAFGGEAGLTAWDVSDGACVLEVADLRPQRYRPKLNCFLALQPDGSAVLARPRNDGDLSPAF